MKQIAHNFGLLGIFLCVSTMAHAQSSSDCDSLLPIQQIATIPYLGSITAFGDLNHNGNVEIVGLGPRPGDPFQTYYPKIFEYQGNNTYKEVYGRERTKSIEAPWWIGDSDDDGLMEMLWTYVVSFPSRGGGFEAAYELLLFEGRDSTSYPAPPTDHWQQDSTARVIWRHVGNGGIVISERGDFRVADLDNDGKKELLFFDLDTVNTTRFLDIWENVGNNRYLRVAQLSPFSDVGFGDVAFGDWDRDGKTEIAIGSGEQVVRVFENTGDNTYEFMQVIPMPTRRSHAVSFLNDADRNGLAELVVAGASYDRGIQIYSIIEAIMDNQYAVVWRDTVPDFPLGVPLIRSGDVDADGKPEMVIYSEEYLRIYKAFAEHDFRCVWHKRAGAIWPPVFDATGNGRAEVYRFYRDTTFVPQIEIYECQDIVAVSERKLANPPQTVILYQNYPNPFNAATLIQWEQTQRAHVRVEVFNIKGRKVKTLMDQVREPGKYQVLFDGTELASGVHFYRLEVNELILTRKALLVR